MILWKRNQNAVNYENKKDRNRARRCRSEIHTSGYVSQTKTEE